MADGVAERVIQVKCLCDAVFEHAQPFRGGFLKFNRTKQIRGLDDDL